MVEREPVNLVGFTEKEGTLLADFILIMKEMRDRGLTQAEHILVQRRHDIIVEQCIDAGLVEDLCNLRDNWRKYFGEQETR